MKRIVIVRFGELPLKSKPVRKKFKKKLIKNIKSAIKDITLEINSEIGRIYIKTSEAGEVSSRLSLVPGIVSSSPSWKTNATMEKIVELSREIGKKRFPKEGSFAIEAKRSGKHEFSSPEIEEIVGSEILKIRPEMEVDLDSPENKLYVEVRNDDAYIFTEKIEGVGGLPVGTQGEIAVVLSNIKNGLASSFSMLKRGATVHPVIFGRERESLKEINNLSKMHSDLKAIKIPFNEIRKKISTSVPSKMRATIYNRIIFEIMDKIADDIGAKSIASDMNLGEISEMTLSNLKLIEENMNLPVFYPLTGFDEKEISKIVEKITDRKDFEDLFKVSKKVQELELDEIRKVEKKISKEDIVKSALKSKEVQTLE